MSGDPALTISEQSEGVAQGDSFSGPNRLPRQVNDRVGSWVVGAWRWYTRRPHRIGSLARNLHLPGRRYIPLLSSFVVVRSVDTIPAPRSGPVVLLRATSLLVVGFFQYRIGAPPLSRPSPCVWRRRLLGRPNRPAHWRTMVRHHRLCPRRATNTLLIEKALSACPYELTALSTTLCAAFLLKWMELLASTQPPVAVQHLSGIATALLQIFAVLAPAAMVFAVLLARPRRLNERLRAMAGPVHNGPRHSGVLCGHRGTAGPGVLDRYSVDCNSP